MYASLIPNRTYEANGFCATADYTILGNSIGIVNSQTRGSPQGA
jgi:hypothetical protein